MSQIDILPGDNGADSLVKIEANFADLYSTKTDVGVAYTKAEADTAFVENSQIDTTITLGTSDTKIPSQKAVKTYADTGLALKAIKTGWETLPALAWVSTDGSTNVVNATGDLTTTLSPGMRFKCQQDQALTAYWNFNADSTSQVGSFNGTDTAMSYTAGKFSNAATFNGTTSKIVIADNASLKPTGEFTIGCWFKTGVAGATKYMLQSWYKNTNYYGILLGVGVTNTLQFQSASNSSAPSTFNGTTTVTDNAWHMVAVSFRNNYVQVYLDGKLEMGGYSVSPTYNATNNVRIGCYNEASTDQTFWNGQIDDLFLINGYALYEKTIKAKYDAQTAQGTGNITIDKYALITAVAPYAAGVTPITIWGGTDYSLANATISSPYYATVSQPFGFNRDKNKWKVEYNSLATISQATPTALTWYNKATIDIPIGAFNAYVVASLNAYRTTAGVADMQATLSTANNTLSDYDMTLTSYVMATGASANQTVNTISFSKDLSTTVKKTMYLNILTSNTSMLSIALQGSISSTIIRLTSTLL